MQRLGGDGAAAGRRRLRPQPGRAGQVPRRLARRRARAGRPAGLRVRLRRRPRPRQASADGRERLAPRRPRRGSPATTRAARTRWRSSPRSVPGVSVPHEVRVDRRDAIREAIAAARAGDVVLLAGKGHEPYQEIAGRRVPFSDVGRSARGARRGGSHDAASPKRPPALGANVVGRDVRFASVSTDTRTIERGRAVRRAARRALRRPRVPRRGARERRGRGDGRASRRPRRRRRPECRCSRSATRASPSARSPSTGAGGSASRSIARHRLQRQDHGEGDARGVPARALRRAAGARDARQPQQRHRPAADAAAAARRSTPSPCSRSA